MTYEDGGRETLGSDGNWKSATGPILMSEIYHGETYDARLEKAGWTRPGFDDREWAPVKPVDFRKDILVARRGPAVKRIEERPSDQVWKTPGGDTVLDLGQNMVGWAELTRPGAGGDDGHPPARGGARQGRELLHRRTSVMRSRPCATP